MSTVCLQEEGRQKKSGEKLKTEREEERNREATHTKREGAADGLKGWEWEQETEMVTISRRSDTDRSGEWKWKRRGKSREEAQQLWAEGRNKQEKLSSVGWWHTMNKCCWDAFDFSSKELSVWSSVITSQLLIILMLCYWTCSRGLMSVSSLFVHWSAAALLWDLVIWCRGGRLEWIQGNRRNALYG